MAVPRDSLILAFILFATPAFAAAPAKHAPAKPAAPAPTATANDPQDLITQAQAARAHGDNDLALRLAQSAIVADPARPSSYDALGDLYAQSGDADYARFYYGEALGIDPGDAAAAKAITALDHGGQTAKADTNAR